MNLQAPLRFHSSQKQWFSLLRWFQRKKIKYWKEKPWKQCLHKEIYFFEVNYKGGEESLLFTHFPSNVFFFLLLQTWFHDVKEISPRDDTICSHLIQVLMVNYAALRLRDNVTKPPLAIHALCIFSVPSHLFSCFLEKWYSFVFISNKNLLNSVVSWALDHGWYDELRNFCN